MKQFNLLMRIELESWRESWVWSVVMISFLPIITLSFLSFIIPSNSVTDVYAQNLVSGAMVFPIILMGINTYAINISLSRAKGEFKYYANLPIRKVIFLFTKLLSGFLMTLPSVFITSFYGQWLFKVKLSFNILAILILFLGIATCVSLGVLIGFLSKNHEVTNIVSQAFMMFISFLSPVMISQNQLPFPLKVVSWFLPTTYIADAFTKSLTNTYNQTLYKDLLILLIFFLVFVVLTNQFMNWKNGKE